MGNFDESDATSYAEINRPNCLILGRFAEKQGSNRFGRLILASRKLARNGLVGSLRAAFREQEVL
jgi:hypothetical protein